MPWSQALLCAPPACRPSGRMPAALLDGRAGSELFPAATSGSRPPRFATARTGQVSSAVIAPFEQERTGLGWAVICCWRFATTKPAAGPRKPHGPLSTCIHGRIGQAVEELGLLDRQVGPCEGNTARPANSWACDERRDWPRGRVFLSPTMTAPVRAPSKGPLFPLVQTVTCLAPFQRDIAHSTFSAPSGDSPANYADEFVPGARNPWCANACRLRDASPTCPMLPSRSPPPRVLANWSRPCPRPSPVGQPSSPDFKCPRPPAAVRPMADFGDIGMGDGEVQRKRVAAGLRCRMIYGLP